MIKICPLVGIVENKDLDIYAVLKNEKVEYMDFHGNSIGEFGLKGFRTHEAKDMWNNTFLPMINFGSFDPQI